MLLCAVVAHQASPFCKFSPHTLSRPAGSLLSFPQINRMLFKTQQEIIDYTTDRGGEGSIRRTRILFLIIPLLSHLLDMLGMTGICLHMIDQIDYRLPES